MKERGLFLVRLFVVFMLFFVVQKIAFMLYNGFFAKGNTLTDMLSVIVHGASLDAATTGYLVAIPWLILLLTFPLKVFQARRWLSFYFVPISLLLFTISVVDCSLYPFWGFKLDSSIFFYLDSPKNAAASVSVAFILLRVLYTFIGAGLFVYILRRITPRRLSSCANSRQTIYTMGGWFLMALPLFLIIRGGVGKSTTNIGQAYFSDKELLNHSAVNPAFSLLASMSKTEDYGKQFNFFEESVKEQLFTGLYPTDDRETQMLLNTTRPNVLIILMESFGATMVESLGGLKDVAPNLERLSHEGIFFTHCYANSFRTDRGTVCTLSGYQSFPNLSVMKIPSKSRTLPSIAQKLHKEGYTTYFLYGGDINFTNMKSYLMESGYQYLKSNVDYSSTERKNAWGVNDDVTFNDLYEQIKNRPSPWHQTFLTLSSHEPFEVPYHRLNEQIPNAFAFTDKCLGDFVEKMKHSKQWDNLLIICLPDHGFHYPRTGSPNSPQIHHMPMLWLGGAVKQPMIVDKLMNQTDMAATLLGQMGIAHAEFNFSRNVMSASYAYPFAYYTFNNGFAFIDSTGYSVFDNNADRVVEASATSERRVDLGKAILQSSYDDLGSR